MSGTSVDGIDVVIADFQTNTPRILHSQCTPFSEQTRITIEQFIQSPHHISLDDLGALNTALGHEYADAILLALNQWGGRPQAIAGIGCHGQTVLHQPNVNSPFSLQLGDGNVIAEKTGITTVNDFRGRDIAAGGQGAPLVPSFHQAVFTHPSHHRVVVNIGGIANITYLSPSCPVMGFDVGVGNALMDLACKTYFDCAFDHNGLLASQGTVDITLFHSMCSDAFFKHPPPKSTGRERFNWAWLEQHIDPTNPPLPKDLLATLCEFTAWGIADAIKTHGLACDDLIVCGGGAYNAHLLSRIEAQLQLHEQDATVTISDTLGTPASDVEALAFAWLAMRTLNHQTNNCPEATHAKGERILGAIHLSHSHSVELNR